MLFKRIFLFVVITTLLTGCSAISETFGKEYLLIDDFYAQLEADYKLTIEEYVNSNEITQEQKDAFESRTAALATDFEFAKLEMKTRLNNISVLEEELGYKISPTEFIQKALTETRVEFEQKIEEASDGNMTLKHAEINRGFLGSIWHFIRKEWLISLIILGIIGTIYEKTSEYIAKVKEDSDGRDN